MEGRECQARPQYCESCWCYRDKITGLVFKEIVHSELEILDRLEYCQHILQKALIFLPKFFPTFLASVPISIFCTSGTCIAPSRDLYKDIICERT